ncbi:hypothetical protein ES702_05270 [subsurface metagenome]
MPKTKGGWIIDDRPVILKKNPYLQKGEEIMLSEEKKLQIYEDVVKEQPDNFGININRAFQQGRITEAEFYSAIGLYRIELALDVVIDRLAALPDALSQ